MKILVTGFDPFGKESINPAIEAVKRLDDEIANAQIIKLEIPTIAHTSLALSLIHISCCSQGTIKYNEKDDV